MEMTLWCNILWMNWNQCERPSWPYISALWSTDGYSESVQLWKQHKDHVDFDICDVKGVNILLLAVLNALVSHDDDLMNINRVDSNGVDKRGPKQESCHARHTNFHLLFINQIKAYSHN